MSNNTVITWRITNMEAIMSYSSLTNVVRCVYWVCEGHDDDNKYGRQWGVQQLNIDDIDPSSYTSYSSLTASQVIGWVKDALNFENPALNNEYTNFTDYIESKVQEEMDSEVIGSRITGMPWS